MSEPRTLRLAKAAKKVADLAHAIQQGALSDVSRLPVQWPNTIGWRRNGGAKTARLTENVTGTKAFYRIRRACHQSGMGRVSRAARYCFTVLARDELLRACDDATDRPEMRDAIHRLALGYLLVTGCVTKPHVRTIWKALGHEEVFSQLSWRQSH